METRHALNGVRWPASNPKVLHVEFSTEAAIQKAVESTAGDVVGLTSAGAAAAAGRAHDAAQRDRAAADERRVRNTGIVSLKSILTIFFFVCSAIRLGQCGNGMWARGSSRRRTVREVGVLGRAAGRGVRRGDEAQERRRIVSVGVCPQVSCPEESPHLTGGGGLTSDPSNLLKLFSRSPPD